SSDLARPREAACGANRFRRSGGRRGRRRWARAVVRALACRGGGADRSGAGGASRGAEPGAPGDGRGASEFWVERGSRSIRQSEYARGTGGGGEFDQGAKSPRAANRAMEPHRPPLGATIRRVALSEVAFLCLGVMGFPIAGYLT